MGSRRLNQSNRLTREQQREAGRLFGRQVSKEKAAVLFAVTLLACAMPMLVGRRLWDRIPEIVETGLIGAEGKDDSMPRAVLVYGIPGLMCVLNTICHGQLWLNQKAERLPPASSRLVGRWGFTVLSVFFASGCSLHAAGEKLTPFFIAVCALALILMICGAHIFDCKKDASFTFRFPGLEMDEALRRKVNRIIGVCWMAAGLLLLFLVMDSGTVPAVSAAVMAPLLVLPVLYGKFAAKR